MELIFVVTVVVIAVALFGLYIAKQVGIGRSDDCGCGKCTEKARKKAKS